MFLITADKSDKVMSLETADLLFLGGPIVNVYIILKKLIQTKYKLYKEWSDKYL